jgi:hypothetical protein
MTSSKAPSPVLPSSTWKHNDLLHNVKDALVSLPSYFKTETNIEGISATDIFTLNSALGATIENQVVATLNQMRSVWDPKKGEEAELGEATADASRWILILSSVKSQSAVLNISGARGSWDGRTVMRLRTNTPVPWNRTPKRWKKSPQRHALLNRHYSEDTPWKRCRRNSTVSLPPYPMLIKTPVTLKRYSFHNQFEQRSLGRIVGSAGVTFDSRVTGYLAGDISVRGKFESCGCDQF